MTLNEWKNIDGRVVLHKENYVDLEWLEFCKLAKVDDINTEVLIFKVTEATSCKNSDL